MRLTCPNCQAQYEVDDSAIPDAGRDVQCSNCKKTWFQEKPKPASPPARPVVAEDRKPKSGSVEDSILGILREEAEREQQARAQDREAANTAVAKLSRGLQEPHPEANSGRPSGPDLGQRPVEAPAPEPVTPAAEPPAEPAKNEVADGAEISRKLKEVTAELPKQTAPARGKVASNEGPARSGFSSGFALVIVLFGVGMVFYTFASTVIEFVPQAEPYLVKYIAFVDAMRMKLDELLLQAIALIESKT